jgi:hypothetical protein
MIGNAPRTSAFAGSAGQVITGTVQENLFIEGKSFSYEDWLTYTADETKTFVFDPTACECVQIVFNPIAFSATAGPIEIKFYVGTTADDDGTLLEASNRRATSSVTPQGIWRLNPSNISLGTEFAGDLVPATGVTSATSTGSQNQPNLPFEVLKTSKYAITVKNTDGADTYVQIKSTWFEI